MSAGTLLNLSWKFQVCEDGQDPIKIVSQILVEPAQGKSRRADAGICRRFEESPSRRNQTPSHPPPLCFRLSPSL
ncbi:hypothetical protein GN956_G15339 [Arapaima gigas]